MFFSPRHATQRYLPLLRPLGGILFQASQQHSAQAAATGVHRQDADTFKRPTRSPQAISHDGPPPSEFADPLADVATTVPPPTAHSSWLVRLCLKDPPPVRATV